LRQGERAAVDPTTPPLRSEGAKVSPDGVLGHVEFESEFCRDNGLALRQTAEDDITSGEWRFEDQGTMPK
jgi:hypothetical protein